MREEMTARCISASPQSPAPLSTSASGTAAVRSQSSTLSIFLLIPSFLSLFVALAEAGGLLVVVFFPPPPTFLNLLILEFLCSFFFFPFSPLLLLPLSLTLYLPLPSFLSVLFLPTIHLRLRWSHRLPLFSSSPSFIPPVCPPVSSTFVSVSIFAAFRRNLRLLIHVHRIGFCCSVFLSRTFLAVVAHDQCKWSSISTVVSTTPGSMSVCLVHVWWVDQYTGINQWFLTFFVSFFVNLWDSVNNTRPVARFYETIFILNSSKNSTSCDSNSSEKNFSTERPVAVNI